MLVLTRKVGETVCIGDNIEVTVVAIRGSNRVRLQFAAPREVVIRRVDLTEPEKEKDVE